MNPKNGFLLIELMIGLTLALFLIVISSHYIIQLKNIQQAALLRIEALSLARIYAEKISTSQTINVDSHPLFTVHLSQCPYVLPNNPVTITMNDIGITWTMQNQKHSLHLHTYCLMERKNS